MKTNQTIRHPTDVINLNSSSINSRSSSPKGDTSYLIGNLAIHNGSVRSLVLLCFLLLCTGTLSAQTIKPTYLVVSEGVSSSIINAVIQDSYGLLWIAGENGIQIYDGYRVQNFKLGLSITNDIVKAHGGELTIETKEGEEGIDYDESKEGTTFTIILPIKLNEP